MDDAAGVQEMQAAGDVHRDLAALVVPRVPVSLVPVEGLPQVSALQAFRGLGFRRRYEGLCRVPASPAQGEEHQDHIRILNTNSKGTLPFVFSRSSTSKAHQNST